MSEHITTDVWWRRLTATRPDTSWRPRVWRADEVAGDACALDEAFERGEIRFVHDTLEQQLVELMDVRTPRRPPPSSEELNERVAEHLAGCPAWRYGNWVHYPWSGRLVHVLPEAEFREVRTSRNRNKITADEQRRLAELDVAIVGLSVGRATALTLALEGVGGHFRLADFDVLALSNLNRLRGGVHELDVNKAILTARALAELDPYLDVTVETGGVTEETLEAFLTRGRRVNLVFEECDDIEMKVRVRETARRLSIPVLMETSDRGMLDIERFDLEPDRPIFHGLAGDLDAAALRGLDTYQKVPAVGAIIGLQTLSQRMAASLIDVDATIKTWPQLGSAVALGGAINTDAARRIALGELRGSGRYYVDLDRLVRDGAASDSNAAKPVVGGSAPRPELPSLRPRRGAIQREEIEALVAHAVMAPSGGNVQPWRFVADAETIQCWVDPARSTTFLDQDRAASLLACGAAGQMLGLAAPALGIDAEIEMVPDPEQPLLAFVARLRRSTNEAKIDPLLHEVGRRCTNRRRAARTPLTEAQRGPIVAEAVRAGAVLQLVEDPHALSTAAEALAAADRQRLLSSRLHREMFAELRWTPADATATRDGLDLATLELDPTERAGMSLLASWEVMQTLRALGGGQGLERSTQRAVEGASALGMLSYSGSGARAFAEGGRALGRIWLRATACGVALQPMTALLYIRRHIARGDAADLAADELEVFEAAGAVLDRVFPPAPAAERLMLFRLAVAPAPAVTSLRRHVRDVLEFRSRVTPS